MTTLGLGSCGEHNWERVFLPAFPQSRLEQIQEAQETRLGLTWTSRDILYLHLGRMVRRGLQKEDYG